jgi:hypothetical protein
VEEVFLCKITILSVMVFWLAFISMSLFWLKSFSDFIFFHTSEMLFFPLMVEVNMFHDSFLLYFMRNLLLALSLLSSMKFSHKIQQK